MKSICKSFTIIFNFIVHDVLLIYIFTAYLLSAYHSTLRICSQEDTMKISSLYDNYKFFLVLVVFQSLNGVWLFTAPQIAAHRALLSITISQSLPKLMSIEAVMPSSHLILCRPLLLLPSIFPSIRVFSNESALSIRWPKYWSFSFSVSPSNEYSGFLVKFS